LKKIVDTALMHEEDKGEKMEIKAEETSQNKKVWPKKGQQQQQQQKKGGKNDKDRDKRRCHNCSKEDHLVKHCKRRKNSCFNYGEVGHFAKECPKKQGSQRQGQRAGTSGGKVHTLAISAPDSGRKISVENLISLSNHPIRILFDFGASHSFISSSMVESLHLITTMVVDPIVVSNPIGVSEHLSMIFWCLKISMSGVEFECDAYFLVFMG